MAAMATEPNFPTQMFESELLYRRNTTEKMKQIRKLNNFRQTFAQEFRQFWIKKFSSKPLKLVPLIEKNKKFQNKFSNKNE